MEDKCRLLIADSSEIVRDALRDILEDSFDLKLCGDGRTALELLHRFRPDVLVVDLMLPGIDGLSLLQAARDADIHPAVLATTRQQNDYILDTAWQLGVSYMMLRPFSLGAITERIQDLALHTRKYTMDPSSQVRRILVRLGFSAKPKSYAMLRDAIVLLAENPGIFLSKELYPAVGKLHNTSAAATEKAIRDLLQSTWPHRDDSVWQLYFPSGADGGRPSNGVFLTRIAQCLSTPLERRAENAESI